MSQVTFKLKGNSKSLGVIKNLLRGQSLAGMKTVSAQNHKWLSFTFFKKFRLLINSLPKDGRWTICVHANQTVANIRLTQDLSFYKVNMPCYWFSLQLQRVLSRALLIQVKEIKPKGLRVHVLLLEATSFSPAEHFTAL